jgi:hypothetical protein
MVPPATRLKIRLYSVTAQKTHQYQNLKTDMDVAMFPESLEGFFLPALTPYQILDQF